MAALEVGFARLLDFWGSLTTYTYDHQPDQHDAAAIASDWKHVGGDIRVASRKADKQVSSVLKVDGACASVVLPWQDIPTTCREPFLRGFHD